MKQLNVVAAIIFHDNKILCMQKGVSKFDYLSFKYEFPGGKVEKEETMENAIIREIREELDMDINVKEPFVSIDYTYPDFSLTLSSFICNSSSRIVTLKEHYSYNWLEIDELKDLDWAAADLPIVKELVKKYG